MKEVKTEPNACVLVVALLDRKFRSHGLSGWDAASQGRTELLPSALGLHNIHQKYLDIPSQT